MNDAVTISTIVLAVVAVLAVAVNVWQANESRKAVIAAAHATEAATKQAAESEKLLKRHSASPKKRR
jgi:hypothetical protein